MNRILLIFLTLFHFSCSDDADSDNSLGSGSSAGGSGEQITTTGSLSIAANDMSATAATTLNVSSPTEEIAPSRISELASSGKINIAGLTEEPPPPGGGRGFADRQEAIAAVLAAEGTEDCLAAIPAEFNLAQGNFGHTACFGPRVAYTNHPNTGESGEFGNGDLGMFFEYSEPDETSGEACSTRIAGTLMSNVASYANAAQGFQLYTTCLAKLAGRQLPELGASLDLATDIAAVDTSANGFELSSGMITRTDDENDFPVFKTEIAGSFSDVARGLTKDFTLTIKHVVTADNNTGYYGWLKFVVANFEGSRDAVISLKHKFEGDGLAYRYRQVLLEDTSGELFDARGEVDSALYGPGWTEVIANVDSIGFGKVSFSWLTFDLLVFQAETKTDGTGSAYFGHQDATVEPSAGDFHAIKGLRCFPQNPPPAGAEIYSNYVQKQSLALNTATGAWEPSSSEIAFAPTTSCSWDGTTGGFTVYYETGGAGSEVAKTLTATTSGLHAVSTYQADWTAPSAP